MAFAFLLTLLFVAVAYLTPAELMPALAPYRIGLILAGVTGVASLLNVVSGKFPSRATQIYLSLAFLVATMWSLVLTGWIGGGMYVLTNFAPTIAAFLFVATNVNSMRRIRILAALLVFLSFFMTLQGALGYYTGYRENELVVKQWSNEEEMQAGGTPSLRRMRAFGFLADPNDLAQQFIVTMPLIMVAWRRRRFIWNFCVVVIPLALLMWGIYMTGSRGAIIGLVLLVFMVAREHMKLVGSGLTTLAGMIGFVALNFGGGRTLAMSEGSSGGRAEAWGAGLAALLQHPLFGVGFNRFTEYHNITAHNMFVLCMTETGMFGYVLWMALLTFCLIETTQLSSTPAVDANGLDRQRWGNAVLKSLVCYMGTGWFLSRTYAPSLYVLLGMAVALAEMDRRSDNPVVMKPNGRWWGLTLAGVVITVITAYALVRIRWAG